MISLRLSTAKVKILLSRGSNFLELHYITKLKSTALEVRRCH